MKQKEEMVDLDIQVGFKINIQKIIVSAVIGCFSLLFISCFPSNRINHNLILDSVNNEREYYYIFTEAIKQQLIGNYSEAEKLLLLCLSINQSPACFYQLSKLNIIMDNYLRALIYADCATHRDSNNIYYLKLLLSLYDFNDNNREKFVPILERISQLSDDVYDIDFQLMENYYKMQRYSDCIQQGNKMILKYGSSNEILFLQAYCYNSIKKYDSAFVIYNDLINNNPSVLEYYVGMFNTAEEFKSKDEVSKIILTKMINPEIHFEILSYYILYLMRNDSIEKSLQQIDVAFTESKNLQDKITIFKPLIKYEKFIDTKRNLFIKVANELSESVYNSDALETSSNIFYHLDSINRAINCMEKLIIYDSTNFQYWRNLLYFLSIKNNLNQIVNIATRAIKIFPYEAVVIYYKGIAEMELKLYEDAILTLNNARKLKSSNTELMIKILASLADVYHRTGNFKYSDKIYSEALQIEPDNVTILNNYSYYLSERGDKLKEALQMSKKTLQTDPNEAAYLDTYGWILFKLKRKKEAKKYIEQALIIVQYNDEEILDHYGEILYSLKNPAEAIKYWNMILQINPERKDILQKIQKVQNAH